MRIRSKLIVYNFMIASISIITSYANLVSINTITENRETITLETIEELRILNELYDSYSLVRFNLTESMALRSNTTEFQLELGRVNESINELFEIEEKPFEQIEKEVGEEETSERIYESWEELSPIYAQIVEFSAPENITSLVVEANRIGERLDDLIHERLRSENEELVERIRITQELSNSLNSYLIVLIVSILIASIVGAISMSQSISNPIKRLVEAIRQISAGNFNVRLPAGSRDEIGELYTDFSEMSEKIRLSTDYLNAQVKSKTRELELANAELKRKDRLKDEFISIASHEMKTPVHPILELAEAAREGLIGHEKAWDLLYEHAKRLQRLTNDILDVSRIETGQLNYQFEKIQINGVIRNLVSEAPISLHKGVRIETALDREIEIWGDKDRLIQVFTNMIDNASKFTKEGTIRIESRVLDEKNMMDIIISDTGVGIPYDILPHIFGKFVTRGESGGSGLGLYICKAIIIAHGGRVYASNNEEGGTTFTISLPIKGGNKE